MTLLEDGPELWC